MTDTRWITSPHAQVGAKDFDTGGFPESADATVSADPEVAPAPAQQQLTAGLEPAGYQISEVLGRGGSATVYRAHESRFDRDVALKILDVATPGSRELARFRRECRTLGRLAEHPNIVDIFDAGTTPGGQPYLTMTLCGPSLADRLRQLGPLPVTTVASHLAQIADALHYSHSRSVVHRDVKPPNILLSSRGAPILTDFGIALTDQSEAHTRTAAFSYQHVAPEVLRGETASARSDIYSLGSTAYHLISGQIPFAAATVTGLIEQILTEPPTPLEGPGMARYWPVIAQAMAKNPADRQVSAAAVADQLRGLLPDLPHRVLVSPSRSPRTTVRLGVVGIAVTAVAVATMAPGWVPAGSPSWELLTGTEAAGSAPVTSPRLSMDARQLGFSTPDPMVADAVSGSAGGYIRDLTSGYVQLASRDAGGSQLSTRPVVEAIGPTGSIVLRERRPRGQLTLQSTSGAAPVGVSVSSEGVAANGRSWNAVVSPNGQFVAFQSTATNLVDFDANAEKPTIFIHDVHSGLTFLGNCDATGAQRWAAGPMHIAGFSTDSRRLLFDSFADKLVPEDRNGSRDVFSRDFVHAAGSVTLLSHDRSARPAPAAADADTRIVGLSPRGGGEAIFMASEGVAFDHRSPDTSPALYERRSWETGVSRYVRLPAAVADTTIVLAGSGQRAAIAPTARADQGSAWSLPWLTDHDQPVAVLPDPLRTARLDVVGFGEDDHSLLVATATAVLDTDRDEATDVYRVPLG